MDKEWIDTISKLLTAVLLPLLIYYVKTTSKETADRVQTILVASINEIKLSQETRFGHITADLKLLQSEHKNNTKRISILESRVNRLQLALMRVKVKVAATEES